MLLVLCFNLLKIIISIEKHSYHHKNIIKDEGMLWNALVNDKGDSVCTCNTIKCCLQRNVYFSRRNSMIFWVCIFEMLITFSKIQHNESTFMNSGGLEWHLFSVSCIVLGNTRKGSNTDCCPCLGSMAIKLRKQLF